MLEYLISDTGIFLEIDHAKSYRDLKSIQDSISRISGALKFVKSNDGSLNPVTIEFHFQRLAKRYWHSPMLHNTISSLFEDSST